MKLHASSLARWLGISVVLCCGLITIVAQREAPCYSGGTQVGKVTCETDQLAQCDSAGSQFVGSCANKPQGKSGDALVVWILSRITGEDDISEADFQMAENQLRVRNIFQAGKVVRHGKSRDDIRAFSFPSEWLEGSSFARFRNIERPAPATTINPFALPEGNVNCKVCVDTPTGNQCQTVSGWTREKARSSAVSQVCGTNAACIKKITSVDCK
jgi:hypothetical protein